MKYLLNHFPNAAVCVGIMILAADLSCFLLWLFRRVLSHESLFQNRELSAVFFETIGLLYSLILAFVMVAAWEDYEDLNGYVIQEAAKLENVLENTRELPDSLQRELVVDIKAYAASEMQTEWSGGNVQTHRHSDSLLIRLKRTLATDTTAEKWMQSQLKSIESDLAAISQLQHNRYGNSHSQMPDIVWFGLLFSSVLIMAISYFFPAQSRWYEYFFNAALAAIMAMSLFIIYTVDHPLLGRSGVSAEPFRKITETVVD